MTNRTVRRYHSGLIAAVLLTSAIGGCGGGGTTNKAASYVDPPANAAAQQAADVSTPTASPETTTPSATPTPATVIKTVTETRAVAFGTRTVRDSALAKGKKKTRTAGRAGVRTLTYKVTVTDGRQTARTLVKSVVTREPVTKVVAVGTKAASSCDPNYSGACVPIAGDVDCAGGGGNGPAYVSGPVRVIGTDVYRLDRDGDGVACDS